MGSLLVTLGVLTNTLHELLYTPSSAWKVVGRVHGDLTELDRNLVGQVVRRNGL